MPVSGQNDALPALSGGRSCPSTGHRIAQPYDDPNSVPGISIGSSVSGTTLEKLGDMRAGCMPGSESEGCTWGNCASQSPLTALKSRTKSRTWCCPLYAIRITKPCVINAKTQHHVPSQTLRNDRSPLPHFSHSHSTPFPSRL